MPNNIHRTEPTKPMKKKYTNESGFTLIEVLIAIVLLTVGFLAFGQLRGKIIFTNTNNMEKTQATTLAQDRMEDIKEFVDNGALLNAANTLDSPTHNGAVWAANAGGENLDAQGNAGTRYNRAWTITPDGTIPNLYTITVTTSWDNGLRSSILITQISQ